MDPNGYFGRKASASSRPKLSLQSPISPSESTPTTPKFNRSLSQQYNSPGGGFRTDDEFYIFEFGSRYMRAGLGGESKPRCKLDFGSDTQRRAGDLRPFLNQRLETRKASRFEDWGCDYELWKSDIRGANLGLLEDKIERAVRRAMTDFVLVMDDVKRRRILLALPPALSHPVLSTVLKTLFNTCPPPPSITLMSTPVLCTVAAGLRSALVVDIGWTETLVSAIYEYREIRNCRSARGMKMLSWEVARLLGDAFSKQSGIEMSGDEEEDFVEDTFQDVEEVVMRMTWCSKNGTMGSPAANEPPYDPLMSIPLPSRRPPVMLSIPFSRLSDPPEQCFFKKNTPSNVYDDHELPLGLLVYNTLLALSVDVRGTCLPRIIITGGGSNIPGLKQRIFSELKQLISFNGWDPVRSYGSAKQSKLHPRQPQNLALEAEASVDDSEPVNKDIDPASTTPTHLQPPLPDPMLANIQRQQPATSLFSAGTGSVRGISTLGAWAGASLIAGLRIKGLVEIERERFLQHGLTGIDRKRDSAALTAQQERQQQRQSIANANAGAQIGRGSGWGLGVWA